MSKRFAIGSFRGSFRIDRDRAGRRVVSIKGIRWDGAHSPTAYWHGAELLPSGTGFGALRSSVVRLLANESYCRRCTSCGYEGLSGHFWDDTCHSCCERAGTVF